MNPAFDCLIVGGGPAGALLAARLAEWGRSVALVHREPPARFPPEETLVPAAESTLAAHPGLTEILSGLDAAGPARHGTIWGSAETVWSSPIPGARGWKVERSRLDAALRQHAVTRGATIALDAQDIEASVTVIATGKSVPSALAATTVVETLPETVAISAELEGDGTHAASVVEAVSAGWLWWLTLKSGRVALTLFADRDEIKARGRAEVWQSAVAEARGPARAAHRQLALSVRAGAPATSFLRRAAPRDVVLVGDAACVLDPLSGQGLEKACASADDAAYAVNTILACPARGELVHAHRERWERRLFRAHARRALEWYAREHRFAQHPFWKRRHAAASALEQPLSFRDLPARLVPHPDLGPVPVLTRRARVLEEVQGFGFAHGDEALERVGPVQVGPLLELFDGGPRTPELPERARSIPSLVPLSLRLIEHAVADLFARGFLVEADTPLAPPLPPGEAM